MAQPDEVAGGADRDVTEIREEIRDFRRATTASMNAIREDLADGFTAMRGQFDALAAGQQQIVDLLNTLIARQDEHHTRP